MNKYKKETCNLALVVLVFSVDKTFSLLEPTCPAPRVIILVSLVRAAV